jgi:hypothetical protein
VHERRSRTNDCQVLHLILGPLHLDLLGLIVDLNEVALDIFAIPSTTRGDLFCSEGIAHDTETGKLTAHSWNSGWVPAALAALRRDSIALEKTAV